MDGEGLPHVKQITLFSAVGFPSLALGAKRIY
jgi:hypothetical protein